MFTKLFGSLVTSSIWSEDDSTRILWITLLAVADRDGFVFGSPSGLSAVGRLPIEAVQASLTKLSEPDPMSADLLRNPESNGRRIEVVDGGWKVINYEHYRDLKRAEDRRQQWRDSKRRAKTKNSTPQEENGGASTDFQSLSHFPPSDAYSDATQKETETDLEPRSPTAPVSVTPGHARSRTTIPQFHRPTVEQVRAYATEMGYEDFDPLGFVAYYEGNGWKVGKVPMKNWKAVVVTWIRRR